MEQAMAGGWPFIVAVVLVPVLLLLVKWLGKSSDDDKRQNREAHGVLHRKIEDGEKEWRAKVEGVAERLRLLEILVANVSGQLKAIEDVPTRREFESAMANVGRQLEQLQATLATMTRLRSGMSGGHPAVRDPRRE